MLLHRHFRRQEECGQLTPIVPDGSELRERNPHECAYTSSEKKLVFPSGHMKCLLGHSNKSASSQSNATSYPTRPFVVTSNTLHYSRIERATAPLTRLTLIRSVNSWRCVCAHRSAAGVPFPTDKTVPAVLGALSPVVIHCFDCWFD